MKALFKFILLLLFLAGWALATAAVHIVATRKPDGTGTRVIVVPKDRIRFEETFADVRAWTLQDVAAHPNLSRRLLDTGKSSALAHVTGETDEAAVVDALNDTLENGPPPPAPAEKAPAPGQDEPSERRPVDPTRRST